MQNCAKWDLVDVAEPDPQDDASSDDGFMASEISLSSDSNDSHNIFNAGKPPASPIQPIIDSWDNPDMELDPEPNDAIQYQEERAEVDDEDDEDWWNIFCVPDLEEAVEEIEDDMQEFEELLHWIDNEMDLEAAQNSMSSITYNLMC
jgi:hypothetical protein